MDNKIRFDEYPGFSVFVDFVQRLAQDVNDPLYGCAVESPTRPVEVCKRALTVSHNMTAMHNKGSLHKCPMCKSVHRLITYFTLLYFSRTLLPSASSGYIIGRLSFTQLMTSVIGIPISSYHFGTSSSHRFRGLPLGRFPTVNAVSNLQGYEIQT